MMSKKTRNQPYTFITALHYQPQQEQHFVILAPCGTSGLLCSWSPFQGFQDQLSIVASISLAPVLLGDVNVLLLFLLQVRFDTEHSSPQSILALGFISSSWRRFCPSMCPSVHPPVHASVSPSIHLSVYPHSHPSIQYRLGVCYGPGTVSSTSWKRSDGAFSWRPDVASHAVATLWQWSCWACALVTERGRLRALLHQSLLWVYVGLQDFPSRSHPPFLRFCL